MQSETKLKTSIPTMNIMNDHKKILSVVRECISDAWKVIAPFWPLKKLIAANPLQGLEDFSFEQAITIGHAYFQQATLPSNIEEINRETIKWCQAFFDEGQATINMPFRDKGLYQAWKTLAPFDKHFNLKNENRIWIENLPSSAEQSIVECLIKLNIPTEQYSLFLTLLLTSLTGWASYVKYRTEWDKNNSNHSHPVTQTDYLAMRLAITCLLWPQAINLLDWHKNKQTISALDYMEKITNAEKNYQTRLLDALSKQSLNTKNKMVKPTAQFIFCIDVRSESFRRALEMQGNYETLGFAGFFGIPAQIKNELTEELYSSCPVLIQPKHTVNEIAVCSNKQGENLSRGKKFIYKMKHLYQALKYNFTTPFVLVEALGPWSGLLMLLRTIMPIASIQLKNNLLEHIRPSLPVKPLLSEHNIMNGIDFNDQCHYAKNILKIIGLTDNFSPLVVLCGHGSETQNNAYASALNCGACGGNHGAANARILAEILNNIEIRNYLAKNNIVIPSETRFIAALHNTTTDEITLYSNEDENQNEKFNQLKYDLNTARKINNRWRCQELGYISDTENDYIFHVKNRSTNWSETRPEWGLARNACFIIGPRHLTKQIDLEGRAFLHSYNWDQDKDGSSLTAILTAPMIVAQWINSQYLFSSLDNIAYGSGSKITHNITGKIGIMQGNGSDLMHGLPLQSICSSDKEAYHQPLRLMTIVIAPPTLINPIIAQHAILQTLFKNEWVSLVCINPIDGYFYHLQRDLTWNKTLRAISHRTEHADYV